MELGGSLVKNNFITYNIIITYINVFGGNG